MQNIERLEKRIAQLEIPQQNLLDRCLDVLSFEEVLELEQMKIKSDEGYTESDLEKEFEDRYRKIVGKLEMEYDRLCGGLR